MSVSEDTYDQEEFLEVLRELGRAGTTAVAGQVGCSEKTAYKRLNGLESDDHVDREKHGGVLVWSLSS